MPPASDGDVDDGDGGRTVACRLEKILVKKEIASLKEDDVKQLVYRPPAPPAPLEGLHRGAALDLPFLRPHQENATAVGTKPEGVRSVSALG